MNFILLIIVALFCIFPLIMGLIDGILEREKERVEK